MYRNLLYHIVFRTKYSAESISIEYEEILYRYIWKYIEEHKGKLYRINGMPNHIHILCDIHPTISISDFMSKLKANSSKFLKNYTKEFPNFQGWGESYGIFSYSIKEKFAVIEYIKNQKTHHLSETFPQEFESLLKEHGIDYDPKYLFFD